MSDSSEDEDLSRFREAVDNSFVKLIVEPKSSKLSQTSEKLKSERYLEISTHYNDVKIPEEMQNRIGAKISNIIQQNIEYVDVKPSEIKKRKIKGGVKLFKNSDGFLSCDGVKDTYTTTHNAKSKKLQITRRQIDTNDNDLTKDEKIKAVIMDGEYVLSKVETTHWKSRRKEKLFKYKASTKNNVLIAVE